MKKTFFLLLFLTTTHWLSAQNTTADSIKATIHQFFEGMKNADTTLIRGALTEGVVFQTILNKKDGTTAVRTENVNDFIAFIAKQPKGRADERISFGQILVDAPLASVWTPYQFYLGDQFSHCGVNSFQLVRISGKWQIQYIIDTRRKTGCE
jgi:hypothetical protein